MDKLSTAPYLQPTIQRSGRSRATQRLLMGYEELAAFVCQHNDNRLRAYEINPHDAIEHFAIENAVLDSGYAYRQVYELVQNAADAITEARDSNGRIHVKLSPRSLEAANTGAPLDQKGIVALLNALRHPDRDTHHIGRFGIGFKSLLKLDGHVDIVSRSVGLRFNPDWCRRCIREHLNNKCPEYRLPPNVRPPAMRLAKVIDPNAPDSLLSGHREYHWATTVVSARIMNNHVFERIKAEMERFPPEFLLFINSDIEITLEVEEGITRGISIKRDSTQEIAEGFTCEMSTVDDGATQSRWKVFHTSIILQSDQSQEDATHVYPGDHLPLAWAVKQGGPDHAGRFWAFCPTETRSLTSGILNAPWKLSNDRTNLVRGPLNDEIMDQAAELIATCIRELASSEDYGLPIHAFPRQPDRQDELAVPLVNSLWRRILDGKTLPDTNGRLRSPSELRRHFIEDTKVCHQWSDLAPVDVRARFVHPDCYKSQNRVSRLQALTEQAKNEGRSVLSRASLSSWLEPLSSTDIDQARQVISFVGELLGRGFRDVSLGVPNVRLIPTVNGDLEAPSKTVITNGHRAPAGFVAVAEGLLLDSQCKRILVRRFKINELSDATWTQLLASNLSAASRSQEAQVWEVFWCSFSDAPTHVRTDFLRSMDTNQLRYRTLSGSWVERRFLVAMDPGCGIPDEFVIDRDYIRQCGHQVPDELLTEFPIGEESVRILADGMYPYFVWVDSPFRIECKVRRGMRPNYGPVFVNRTVELPAKWWLLARLARHAPEHAFRLTKLILEEQDRYKFHVPKLEHETTPNNYPRISAPHPFWYLLTQFGYGELGGLYFPLKAICPQLARTLTEAGLVEFAWIASFFSERSLESDLKTLLDWPTETMSQEHSERFWGAVFHMAAAVTAGFSKLWRLWEAAGSSGFVPSTVPTADGSISLSKIYVTDDSTIEPQVDDGRIVVLSDACHRLWIEAGAVDLTDEVRFRAPSEPAHLLDLFPEFAVSDALQERLTHVQAVWVEELVERLGPHERETTVTIPSWRSNASTECAILLNRPRLTAVGRRTGIEQILRCLSRYRLIPTQLDFDTLLTNVRDRRRENARRDVRNNPTLAARLLHAVGNNTDALLSALTQPTRTALEGATPLEVADLTIAVHGPEVLSKLRTVLNEQGLEPPKRWGGEQARSFVLDLGFPLEFASTVAGHREAEAVVSGPISLPELHDFQQKIVNEIENLVSSGAGRRRAIVSLPTGAGKTRAVAEAVVRLVLCRDGRRSVLWVAQTNELCEQAFQCFRQLWVNVGNPGEDLRIVRLWAGRPNPPPSESDDATVVVASIQTLNSRIKHPDLAWIAEAGIIVIDECHHAIAPSYTGLMRWLGVQVGAGRSRNEVPVLGLSATPWRGYNNQESERLAERFNNRWFPADQAGLHNTLTARGVLAARTYTSLRYNRPVELSLRERRHVETFGELPESLISRIGKDADRNRLIVNSVLNSRASSILLFANSVAHAEYLAASLHLGGCTAAAVSGQTNELTRQHFTRRFESGELRVICNHSVFTTGFDAPKTDMILISRPVFSPVRYMQMVGRGLRGPKNGGTKNCKILTVEDNILNYGDQLAYHFCRRYFTGSGPAEGM